MTKAVSLVVGGRHGERMVSLRFCLNSIFWWGVGVLL